MTLDIEEYRIIKTLKEVMEKAIKEQQHRHDLVVYGTLHDKKYKQKQRDKLEKYKKAMEWLERQ